MGSALRKELFGDDEESDSGSAHAEADAGTAGESTGRSEAAQAKRDYEKYVDGQEDLAEDENDQKKVLGRPRAENRPFDETASQILYRLCAYTEVTAEQTATLLQLGANPNYIMKGNRGNGMLHLLGRRGVAPGAVGALLSAGCVAHSVNAFNQTPLMLACDTARTGDTLSIVKLLCAERRGLNLELRDLGGNSALLNSIYKSNPWVCRELLLAGASAVQGEPGAFDVALWVFSESLAQDLETLPKDVYEGETCCLPGCPLGSPTIDYTGTSGWWRVLLQGARMPDYEIVMRMVHYRKELEHMFDAPRGQGRPLSPPGSRPQPKEPISSSASESRGAEGAPRLPTIREGSELSGELMAAGGGNGASAVDAAQAHVRPPGDESQGDPSGQGLRGGSKSERMSQQDKLRAESARRTKRRSDWKRQKVQDRKEKREMEERRALAVKFVDIQQAIEETYSHTVAPKRKPGKDVWSRAPNRGGGWARPEEEEHVEYE